MQQRDCERTVGNRRGSSFSGAEDRSKRVHRHAGYRGPLRMSNNRAAMNASVAQLSLAIVRLTKAEQRIRTGVPERALPIEIRQDSESNQN